MGNLQKPKYDLGKVIYDLGEERVMEEFLYQTLNGLPTIALVAIIAFTLYTLSKGADILVDEAVSLSVIWGIPKMIIGATIVSLGTTLPEATVSVLAAVQGNPDLALGNAMGSIIADTGLIIGLAAIIGRLPVDKATINRQGRVQLGAGLLLAFACLPILTAAPGGHVPQFVGFIFLALLALYLYFSMKWAKTSGVDEGVDIEASKSPVFVQVLKLLLGVALVIISSRVLIPTVEVSALRVGVPQSIIAATLVAFGTSLPELVTAITAVRKGHGELAIGNIIGADVLNVLFVVGSAAAVTSEGLAVPETFFKLQIPAMLIILVMFRIFGKNAKDVINRKEGFFLVGIYLVYLVLNFTWAV